MTAQEKGGAKGTSRASIDQAVREGRTERRSEGRRSLCRPRRVAIETRAKVRLATGAGLTMGKAAASAFLPFVGHVWVRTLT